MDRSPVRCQRAGRFQTEERSTFYNQVNEITQRSAIILAGAIVLAVLLVLLFAGYLTRPLTASRAR